MDEERGWQSELRWIAWTLVALLAVMLVFSLVQSVLETPSTTVNADRILGIQSETIVGDRVGWFLWSALARPEALVLLFWPFITGSIIGMRLIVPVVRRVPRRVTAAIVAAWPLALGADVIVGSFPQVAWLIAIGIAWALITPLPGDGMNWLSPLERGVLAGLAFAALALYGALLFACVWGGWVLYRRRPVEAAGVGFGSAIVPALLLMRAAGFGIGRFDNVLTILLAIVCLGIGFVGVAWSQFGSPAVD